MHSDQDSGKPGERCAYLVRLWRAGPQQPWRASVRQVTDGLELHFASLEELILFFYEQVTPRGGGDASVASGGNHEQAA